MGQSQEAILKSLAQPPNDGWTKSLYGWDPTGDSVPVCDWDGIGCNVNGQITQIILPHRNIVDSTIPRELGDLSELSTLVLVGNEFTGTIPDALANQLTKLARLDLSNNRLVGGVPVFMSQKLTTLNLSFNALEGPLSSRFYYGHSGHEQLKDVDLMNNRLTGTISEAIGTWSSIETLSLSNNTLSGTMPIAFGLLTSKELKYVYLNANRLVGTISSEFANPKAVLREVWLHENMLSGTVPAAFAQMSALDDLFVDGNKFVGTIPPDICTDEINSDFITDLRDETESVSKCYKIACPQQTFSIEGVWPCKACPRGTSMPYLGGELRCFPRDTDSILRQFYEDTDGDHWTISDRNWFREGVNHCSYTGVTCNDESHVIGISLPEAHLVGTISPELGFLEHLRELNLRQNALHGFLPSDLRLTQLEVLDVSGNALRGPVPPMMCRDGGINGNGKNGIYHCDFIACPPGTASPSGRRIDDMQCTPCGNGANILGLRDCQDYYHGLEERAANRTMGVALLVLTCLGLVGALAVVYFKKVRERRYFGVEDPSRERAPLDASSMMQRTQERRGSQWSSTSHHRGTDII